MWLLYWFATTILLLVGWPVLLVHPKLRWSVLERFGLSRWRAGSDEDQRPIWFHASSAGDVRAIWPILRDLGDLPALISCSTDSGAKTASTLAAERPCVAFPLDHPLSVALFLARTRPRLLVLEYAELWPELLRQLRRRRIPVIVTNGTLSPRSVSRYLRLRALFGPLFSSLEHVFVRDAANAERFRSLGVPAERLEVVGSTKVDGVLQLAEDATDPPFRCDLIVGSAHADEFETIAELLFWLRTRRADARLVVVPRYVHDAPALVRELEKRGLASQRYSSSVADAGTSQAGVGERVLVVDATGVLFAAYAGARLALIGGSFGARGGQNPLEPAAFGVPTLCGPNMSNFAAELEWLRPAGLVQCKGVDELLASVESLLDDEARARLLGSALRSALAERAGISRLIARRVRQIAQKGV